MSDNFVKSYKAEVWSDAQQAERYKEPVLSYKKIFDNKRLVDTAGFVPLDVRIKQFLIGGEQAKFSAEMFDSDDWRYMYNNINENALEISDDVEDVHRKMALVMARQNELLLKKGYIKPKEDYAQDQGATGKSVAESKSDDEGAKSE